MLEYFHYVKGSLEAHPDPNRRLGLLLQFKSEIGAVFKNPDLDLDGPTLLELGTKPIYFPFSFRGLASCLNSLVDGLVSNFQFKRLFDCLNRPTTRTKILVTRVV